MRVDTISEPAVRPAVDKPNDRVATFRARVGGYVVDMVIFAAVAMLVVVVAGFILLWSTDWAEQDGSDADFYTFISIIALGTPLVWTLLNLALLATRSQTGGQYVAGVRLANQDVGRLSWRDALVWWFSLNPLLFSWPMAFVAGGGLAVLAALVTSVASLFLFALVVLVCFAAPIVAFVAAMVDSQNRTLHDRIARTLVVPAGVPH